MLLEEFDVDKYERTLREEGTEQGVDKMARLIRILMQSNRVEDLERASTDEEYRERLFQEFYRFTLRRPFNDSASPICIREPFPGRFDPGARRKRAGFVAGGKADNIGFCFLLHKYTVGSLRDQYTNWEPLGGICL